MENLNEKNFDTILTEANDMFRAQGLSITGEGYKEIATNDALLESYIESLTMGATANAAVEMADLMVNTNKSILQESSVTGIQPISSLSMPVIRKLWPKFALKDAVKTEVAKTPRFSVSYTKPYLQKGDGEKIYLPNGLRDSESMDNLSDAGKKKYINKTVELAAGAASVIDFKADSTVTTAGSNAKVQPLDELRVVSVMEFVDAKVSQNDPVVGMYTLNGTTYTLTTDTVAQAATTYYIAREAKIGKRLSVLGNAIYDLADGKLIVTFDGKNNSATVAYVNGTNPISVTVKAGVSTEYNEEGYSVGFEIARQDIDIPTGLHINSPLPIEALNDMMALYQIDGLKETIDLMTNTFAMKLDLEILDFIQESFINQPTNEAFFGGPDASEFSRVFDCLPAAGYAGRPQSWREEIKPMIDFLATSIKNSTYLQNGMYTIVGNPLDINIITNVDWQFRGGQGANMDGVSVDYSVGSFIGANTYKVLASPNVPQGAIYILFIPTGNTQMTYTYYPYAFSIESGYIDPNRSRVPSIMMTKRDTKYSFMNACACIQIENNNGSPYNQFVRVKKSDTDSTDF